MKAFLRRKPPPPAISYRAATLARSSRSSHDLERYWIVADIGSSNSANYGLHDDRTTMPSNALLTPFLRYQDVTETNDDQQSRLPYSHYAAATTFKIIQCFQKLSVVDASKWVTHIYGVKG